LTDGGFRGYSGAIHDISGRYEAELGEKRWRLFLDGVMENIPAIITVSDLKTGRYYYVNRDAERFFRLGRGELLNLTIHDMMRDLKSPELTRALEEAAAHRQKVVAADSVQFGKKAVKVSARFVPMRLSADMEYIITIFFTE
ncbi:MAG TPA: PAS domain-containing protein, partial [Methanocorpusculum sp.]|nr:PAS domain-containing protein [Methanocorpusculum sp.]